MCYLKPKQHFEFNVLPIPTAHFVTVNYLKVNCLFIYLIFRITRNNMPHDLVLMENDFLIQIPKFGIKLISVQLASARIF